MTIRELEEKLGERIRPYLKEAYGKDYYHQAKHKKTNITQARKIVLVEQMQGDIEKLTRFLDITTS